MLMSVLIRVVLIATIVLPYWVRDVRGQQSRTQEQDVALQVPGPPYDVPEIKLFLTDEETNGPFANHEVYVEYFWGWKVLKHTPEADRMERLKNITVKALTDDEGMVLIPAKIIIPARPQPPEGAEFSEPVFQFVEIEVQDSHHNCGLFIDAEDIEEYRGGSIGDFHRTVPIWKRTSALSNPTNRWTRAAGAPLATSLVRRRVL
jgi:hypothetical protein